MLPDTGNYLPTTGAAGDPASLNDPANAEQPRKRPR
jgi:hypothetical protein